MSRNSPSPSEPVARVPAFQLPPPPSWPNGGATVYLAPVDDAGDAHVTTEETSGE